MKVKFVMTAGIADTMEGMAGFHEFVHRSIQRFLAGDWGEISSAAKQQNDLAADQQERIVAAYDFPKGLPTAEPNGMRKIWIIADDDQDVATVLFPDEY